MGEDTRIRDSVEDTHVRDRLALIRTVLANERTFLSFLRTSLALSATGFTAVHFIPSRAATWTGAILLALGVLCLAYGLMRFRMARNAISREEHPDAGYKP
jgi:putative membrane protein